jgi:hypothetical protein
MTRMRFAPDQRIGEWSLGELEPLTSSMSWWPGMHRRRAASLDGVLGRAGAPPPFSPGLSLPLIVRTATEAIGAAVLSLGGQLTALRWAELRGDRKPLVPRS